MLIDRLYLMLIKFVVKRLQIRVKYFIMIALLVKSE